MYLSFLVAVVISNRHVDSDIDVKFQVHASVFSLIQVNIVRLQDLIVRALEYRAE